MDCNTVHGFFHHTIPLEIPWLNAPPVIGFLSRGSAASRGEQFTAFDRGLAEAGYVNGQTARISRGGTNLMMLHHLGRRLNRPGRAEVRTDIGRFPA
jgi:hypothetical protein